MLKNIILIGFMGSGKSTLTRILQEKLQWPAFSTDAYIEEKEGRSIARIFHDSGEAYFRSLEHRAVLKLSERQGIIVDCGGGVVLNPENIRILKETGTVIYLSCDPEVIYERIRQQPKRPLLDVKDPLEKIKELLKSRLLLYEQADITINTSDGDMMRVAQEVIAKVVHD